MFALNLVIYLFEIQFFVSELRVAQFEGVNLCQNYQNGIKCFSFNLF